MTHNSHTGAGERSALTSVLEAIHIETPERAFFAGEPLRVRGAAASPWAGAARGRAASPVPEHLRDGVAALQLELYSQAYAFPFEGRRRTAPTPSGPDEAFLALLAAANSTHERWQEGWTVQGTDGAGRVIARRGSSMRSFRPNEIRANETPPVGAAPATSSQGTPARAFSAKGSADLQPGFYVVFGESMEDEGSGSSKPVRVYFNVDAEGAAPLVAHLTHRLNRFQVPFTFKILSQPGYFALRADAAVLYLQRRHFHVAAQLAQELPAVLGQHLGPQIPLFTKELSPGISVAEDPGTGESFGQSRCRLLSEATWRAWASGEQSTEARLESVERSFTAAGLSLEAAHLCPGSTPRHLPADSRLPDYQLLTAAGGP